LLYFTLLLLIQMAVVSLNPLRSRLAGVVVLSTKDGKWFLRTFNLEGSTPDVVLPHNAEYSGNGLAKNFIYRHANTSITYN
ncbi:MAG: hypothetical protein PHV73_01800, partial [Eubacteriales bacterium]|nr:hypothetical protein [Eubacteriales bacterium]